MAARNLGRDPTRLHPREPSYPCPRQKEARQKEARQKKPSQKKPSQKDASQKEPSLVGALGAPRPRYFPPTKTPPPLVVPLLL